MDFLDLLAVLFHTHDLTKEYLPMFTDYAGLASLLVFVGGLCFWAMILFGVGLGVCRGIMYLVRLVRDLLTPVNIDLELARRHGE